MRLQRIYSSKVYVTNSRKDKIHAAIQDPVNAELVQQLEDYLDDDAKIVLKRAVSEKVKKTAPQQSTSPDAAAPDLSAPSGSSAPSGGSRPSFTGNVFDDFGGDDLLADIPDEPAEGGSDSAPVEEPEPVESVTKEGKPITSSTAIVWTTLDNVVDDCETIKGTLNGVEDTTGVIRLQVKDSELWIYYNDDSNLNDKMIEVISCLNSLGYTYLKFNRLARSNNAIVFDILLNANDPIKTVKEVEEETK